MILGPQKFEYDHVLKPSLREFKWHLRDEIFQMQTNDLKNMKAFYKHMEHIQRGCSFLTTTTSRFIADDQSRNNNANKVCHIERHKLVLNRVTVTTTTTMFDAQPKTNASKLPGAAKSRRTQHVEEDPTIINVDMAKFFAEFHALLKGLNSRLFNCKLQQMNVQQDKNVFFYLQCDYDMSGRIF